MSKPSIREQIKQIFGKYIRSPLYHHKSYLFTLQDDVLALLDGCAIIDKKDWREIANFLETQPSLGDKRYREWCIDTLDDQKDRYYSFIGDQNVWIAKVKKKFAELTEQ